MPTLFACQELLKQTKNRAPRSATIRIVGTGDYGRVVKANVVAAKARGHTGVAAAGAHGAAVDGSIFFPDFTDMPVKMVQKITAQRLTESKQQIPHYYLSVSGLIPHDNLGESPTATDL
eukprot:9470147-Pyramimonas_sp.AAC.1